MVKFVVTKNRRYWWPIKVQVPAEDLARAGEFDTFEFKARFEAIDKDEAQAVVDRISLLPEEQQEEHQNAQLQRVVVGWDDDIHDKDGKPLPFDPETFAELLKDAWILKAFLVAWTESMVGGGARKGN